MILLDGDSAFIGHFMRHEIVKILRTREYRKDPRTDLEEILLGAFRIEAEEKSLFVRLHQPRGDTHLILQLC